MSISERPYGFGNGAAAHDARVDKMVDGLLRLDGPAPVEFLAEGPPPALTQLTCQLGYHRSMLRAQNVLDAIAVKIRYPSMVSMDRATWKLYMYFRRLQGAVREFCEKLDEVRANAERRVNEYEAVEAEPQDSIRMRKTLKRQRHKAVKREKAVAEALEAEQEKLKAEVIKGEQEKADAEALEGKLESLEIDSK